MPPGHYRSTPPMCTDVTTARVKASPGPQGLLDIRANQRDWTTQALGLAQTSIEFHVYAFEPSQASRTMCCPPFPHRILFGFKRRPPVGHTSQLKVVSCAFCLHCPCRGEAWSSACYATHDSSSYADFGFLIRSTCRDGASQHRGLPQYDCCPA